MVSALPVQAPQARSISPLTETCQQFTRKAKRGIKKRNTGKFWTERQGVEREAIREVMGFVFFFLHLTLLTPSAPIKKKEINKFSS